MGLRFSWDARKAASNLRKHGIEFVEATTAFDDPLSITVSDPDHSVGEERYLLVGATARGRLVVVSHMDEGEEIRIISARDATLQERKGYEEDR